MSDLGLRMTFLCNNREILSAYGGAVTADEMLEIKRPIIGEISLRRKKNIDYSIPTYIRIQTNLT